MSELDDVKTTVGVIEGLRTRIAELEAENQTMREWRAGWDGVCKRCPRSQAEAALAERDRMLDECVEFLTPLQYGERDLEERITAANLLGRIECNFADLRARAEKGDRDGRN